MSHPNNTSLVEENGAGAEPRPYAPRLSNRRQVPPDLGRPELRKFMVAHRHVDAPVWPMDFEAKILDARRKYEEGTHEMCQGRDVRGYFVLYLIPRRVRTGARKFFATHS